MTHTTSYRFEDVQDEVEAIRARLNRLRHRLASFFVGKRELVDAMVVSTLAQEPLLIVGPPGTAKSDLIVKFCESLGLGEDDYFEYMLTKFTEPSEIIGPIDLEALKEGRYVRRVAGKLPHAKIVFLDEIFKSNSAILNTLLTIINERKFYQDGLPTRVEMKMLFGATNEIPPLTELDALNDRFTLKVESAPVREQHFEALIDTGLDNASHRALQQRPWANLASLDDFMKLKAYLDHTIAQGGDLERNEDGHGDRQRYFPAPVFALFKRIIKTLEREDGVRLSDRRVIKLYLLIRARALLFHGGVVARDDLRLLRYVGDRTDALGPVRDKVDALLRID